MSDKQPSRTKRLALRIIGHPGVVVPSAVAGVAVAASILVASPWLILAAAGCGAVAVGVGAFQMLFRMGNVADEIAGEEQRKRDEELGAFQAEREAQAQATERDLDSLRERLAEDEDQRDEKLLDRLREINGRFGEEQSWYKALNSVVRERVRETFQNLFEDAIARLRSSVELRDQTSMLEFAALVPLKEAREQLLNEVTDVVGQMASVLGGIQALGIRAIADKALSHGDAKAQMTELEAILTGAQAAHERVSAPARDRKHEAFRQRLRADREAERSGLEPETAQGEEEDAGKN